MAGAQPHRIIIGAGAQGRVVLDVWRAQNPTGSFLFADDDPLLHGRQIGGAPVIGAVSVLDERPEDEAVIALGHNPRRLMLGQQWPAIRWGRVFHPSAVISPAATVGPGTVVFAGAILNTDAQVGNHVIVNTAAVIEHDCILEDGASLGPGTVMAGRVHIGRGAFISAGVVLAPRVRVGAGTVVGAGAVVTADLPAHVLAFGVPARVVRAIDDGFDWKRLL